MFYNTNPDLYCMYCKDQIDEGEAYVVQDNHSYHIDCFQQMNRFIDSFGDNLDYNMDEEDE